jgi:type II secretory pathway pseudopilin PulG
MSSGSPLMAALRHLRLERPSPDGPRPGRRGQGGMSLVEVLVATALLGGALLSLCSLFFFGIRNNAAAKHDTVMAAYLQDKMETLKQETLGGLIAIQDAVESSGTPLMEYFVEGEGWKSTLDPGDTPEYRREWEVHDVVLNTNVKQSGDFNNTVKEVTVRCFAYKSKKGDTMRSVEIRTFRRIN